MVIRLGPKPQASRTEAYERLGGTKAIILLFKLQSLRLEIPRDIFNNPQVQTGGRKKNAYFGPVLAL